jgi:hypothetical protein
MMLFHISYDISMSKHSLNTPSKLWGCLHCIFLYISIESTPAEFHEHSKLCSSNFTSFPLLIILRKGTWYIPLRSSKLYALISSILESFLDSLLYLITLFIGYIRQKSYEYVIDGVIKFFITCIG